MSFEVLLVLFRNLTMFHNLPVELLLQAKYCAAVMFSDQCVENRALFSDLLTVVRIT